MSLEELERRLEDSMRSLREENKTLIELLQSRQSQFYNSVRDYPDLEQSTEGRDYRQTVDSQGGSVRTVNPRLPDTEVLGISKPRSSKLARQKLLACRKGATSEDDGTDDDAMNTEPHGMVQSFASLDDRFQADSQYTANDSLLSTSNKTVPKSILRRREIIDNHVKVASKYDHGPDWMAQQRSRLNYSYDDVGENDLGEPTLIDSSVSRTAAVPKVSDIDANAERYLDHLQTQRRINEELRELDKLRDQRLLTASGNDRQKASVVRELSQRPKNVLFDVNEPDPDTLEETMKRYRPDGSKGLKRFNYKADLNASRQGPPLLGYDWIVGVLENEGLWDQSEELFHGISEFRKTNKEDCVGKGPLYEHSLDLTRPISPQIEDPGHTCIHGFNVNERLFTEAINIDEEGKSICPVCLISRKEPTPQEPAFVRVSIPKSTVENAYKIKPHTRKSYEPSDSMALSHHCLAGWKSTKPSTLPTARTLDIKDKIIHKETTTYDEARQVAESFSRMGRLLTVKDPPKARLTKKLLDANTSFRYEMDTIQKLCGLNTDNYRTAPVGKA